MNDDELDRRVAATVPVTVGQVASLGLGDAATELMDEIMATSTMFAPEVVLTPGSPPPRARRRVRIAVAAVGALAAATIAVVVVTAGSDGDRDRRPGVSADGEPELPRLIADPPPEGYPNLDIGDTIGGTETAPGEARQTLALYGDVTAEEPTGDLIVSTFAVPGGEDSSVVIDRTGWARTTVRGHDGQVCAAGDPCAESSAVSGIGWSERSDLDVELRSRAFDVDQLTAIAETLVVDGDQVSPGELPSDIDGSLDEVGHVAYGGSKGGYYLRYRPDDAPAGPTPEVHDEIWLTLMVGDEVDLAYDAWLAETRQPVTVRGHDGWLLTSAPESGSVALVWFEAPGVIASAQVTSADPDKLDVDLVAFAESLRPATDEEWQADRELGHADLATVESHIPADAQASATTDALGGAAYLAADGQICGFMVDERGRLPDTCGSTGERIHELRDRDGEVRFLFGTMPAGAHDVSATRPDVDNPNPAFHDDAPDGYPRIWILTTDIFVPETLTFRDANTRRVETVTYTP